ncbi:ABC transporter ATP-binding protein [Roseomonas terrae]|jgi:branched-chain amino acid transport system ATP-binding protein|uniref:ABC transporter ATP-binding protein n=1 Tax=Neoroseomonas terrae TaxID=424799 RepID=A0ABS5EFM2_9PROT|nr:ABC transporter ATP-binding protein [Neoroseomonas terrae]MBR0649819.1 ABC transporter ATP-binding protein [Neoroseomonas terrae]
MTTEVLRTENLSRSFGGVQAVAGVSLTLHAGAVTALVGPNGAGKTTTFNLITGNLRADSGTAAIRGKPIMGLKPWQVARLGVARSFQDLRLFTHMTVRENVLAATETASWFWQPGGSTARRAREARADAALEATGLSALARARAIDLAYAERKFLSMARILAAEADIWLLDEPASGLDLASRTRFGQLLKDAQARGVAICLIEHNLDVVVELSNRIAFLDQGKVLAEGDPDAILKDPALAAIYFGDRPQEAA